MKRLLGSLLLTAWSVGVIYVLSYRRASSVVSEEPSFDALCDLLQAAIRTRDPKAMGWAQMLREKSWRL